LIEPRPSSWRPGPVKGSPQALDLPDCRSYTAITMVPRNVSFVPVLILAGSIAFLSAGCGSKKVHYPEDHERYVRIDRAVESLRLAYVREDSSDLAALMMPGDQLERLKEEAKGDFETFGTIALDFTIERIMIDGDNIDVFVHWQGLWKKDAEDSGLRQRGHSKLQWVSRGFSLWYPGSAGYGGPLTFFQKEVINAIS
jgi:hypothetical protein